MTSTRSSPPPAYRTQRALSMAAETRRPRNLHLNYPHPTIDPEFLYNHPSPSPVSPSSNSHAYPPVPPSSSSSSSSSHSASSLVVRSQNTPENSLFGEPDQFQRSAVPSSLADQRKEAKIAQRQRREQIVLKLQQEQIEAQEKAKAEKLERQRLKLERKQKRTEIPTSNNNHHQDPLDLQDQNPQLRYRLQDPQQLKQQHRLHQPQRSLPIHPYATQPEVQYQSSQYYHVDGNVYQHQQQQSHQNENNGLSSSSSTASTTASRSSRSTPDRLRSLSLKDTHKSMYDLRPSWSGGPSSPTVPAAYDHYQQPSSPQQQQQQDYYYHSGYESDENSSSRSHGWDSLMDTLHSPTVSSPSDDSWDSKDEPEMDLMETMSSLTLNHNNSGSGNGKYLLSKFHLPLFPPYPDIQSGIIPSAVLLATTHLVRKLF